MINNSNKLIEYQIFDSNLKYINALTNLESIVFNASDGIDNDYNYKFLYKHAPLFVDINTLGDMSYKDIETSNPLDINDDRNIANVSIIYPVIDDQKMISSDISTHELTVTIPDTNLIVMSENIKDGALVYKAEDLKNYMNAKEMHCNNFNISDIFANYISKEQCDILLQRMNYKLYDISTKLHENLLNDEMLNLMYKNSSVIDTIYTPQNFFNICNNSQLVPGCVYKIKKEYHKKNDNNIKTTFILYVLAINTNKILNDVLKYDINVSNNEILKNNLEYYKPHFKCNCVYAQLDQNDLIYIPDTIDIENPMEYIPLYYAYDEKGNSFNLFTTNENEYSLIGRYFELLSHSSQNMYNVHFESMPNIKFQSNDIVITLQDSYMQIKNEALNIIYSQTRQTNYKNILNIGVNNIGDISIGNVQQNQMRAESLNNAILYIGNNNKIGNQFFRVTQKNCLIIIGNENENINIAANNYINLDEHIYYIIGNNNADISISGYNVYIKNNSQKINITSNNTAILSPLSIDNYALIDPLWELQNGIVTLFKGIHDFALIYDGSMCYTNDSSLRNTIEFIANQDKNINEILNKLPKGISNNKQHESFIYGNIEKYNGISGDPDNAVYYDACITSNVDINSVAKNIILKVKCEDDTRIFSTEHINYKGQNTEAYEDFKSVIQSNVVGNRVIYKIYPYDKNIESEDLIRINYNYNRDNYDNYLNIYKLIHLYYSYDMHSYYARHFYEVQIQDKNVTDSSKYYSLEFYDDIEKYTFDSSDLIVNVNLYDTYNPSIHKETMSNINNPHVWAHKLKGFIVNILGDMPNKFEYGLYGKDLLEYSDYSRTIYMDIKNDKYDIRENKNIDGYKIDYPEEFHKIAKITDKYSPYGHLQFLKDNLFELVLGNCEFPNYVEFAKFKPYIKTDKATYIFNYENNYIPEDALFFTTNYYFESANIKIYSDNNNIVKFSYDYVNWYDFALFPEGVKVSNKKLYVKGKLALNEKIVICNSETYEGSMFNGVYAFGNIGYLLNESPYISNDARTCEGLFENCTLLKSAPDLPIGNKCEIHFAKDNNYYEYYMAYKPNYFKNMFKGCTGLQLAPKLPNVCIQKIDVFNRNGAIIKSLYLDQSGIFEGMFDGCTSLNTLQNKYIKFINHYCKKYKFIDNVSEDEKFENKISNFACKNMFRGCTSLTQTLDLPINILAESCYESMYEGCTALENAQDILPIKTLERNCCKSMFKNCSNLNKAPELPAIILAYGCYDSMFYGCSSLQKAPYLPALTLTNRCYHKMFYNCPSLNYIEAAFNSYSVMCEIITYNHTYDIMRGIISGFINVWIWSNNAYVSGHKNTYERYYADFAISGCTYLMLGGTTNLGEYDPSRKAIFSTFAINNTYTNNGYIKDPCSGVYINTSTYEVTYNTIEHTKKVLNKLCIFFDSNWGYSDEYSLDYIIKTDNVYHRSDGALYSNINKIIRRYINCLDTYENTSLYFYDVEIDYNYLTKYSRFNINVDCLRINTNQYISSNIQATQSGIRIKYGTQIVLNTSNCFDIAFTYNNIKDSSNNEIIRLGQYDKLNTYNICNYGVFTTIIDLKHKQIIDSTAPLIQYPLIKYNKKLLNKTLYNNILETIRKNNLNLDVIQINSMAAPDIIDYHNISRNSFEQLSIQVNNLNIDNIILVQVVNNIFNTESEYFVKNTGLDVLSFSNYLYITLGLSITDAHRVINKFDIRSLNNKRYYFLKEDENYPLDVNIDQNVLDILNKKLKSDAQSTLMSTIDVKCIGKIQLCSFFNMLGVTSYKFNDIILIPKLDKYVSLQKIDICVPNESVPNMVSINFSYFMRGNIVSGYSEVNSNNIVSYNKFENEKIIQPYNINIINHENTYNYVCADVSILRFNALNNNTYDINKMFSNSDLIYPPKILPAGNYNNTFENTSLYNLPILLDINNSSLQNFISEKNTTRYANNNKKILKNVNYNETHYDTSLNINGLNNMILEVDEINLNNYELWSNNMTTHKNIKDITGVATFADINIIKYTGDEDAFLKFEVDINDFINCATGTEQNEYTIFQSIFGNEYDFSSYQFLNDYPDCSIYLGFKSIEDNNVFYFIPINEELRIEDDINKGETYKGVNINKHGDDISDSTGYLSINILSLIKQEGDRVSNINISNVKKTIKLPYSLIIDPNNPKIQIYLNFTIKYIQKYDKKSYSYNNTCNKLNIFQINELNKSDGNLIKCSVSGNLQKINTYHQCNIKFNSDGLSVAYLHEHEYSLLNLYSAKYLKCNNVTIPKQLYTTFMDCINLKYPPTYYSYDDNLQYSKSFIGSFKGCRNLQYLPIIYSINQESYVSDITNDCNNLSYMNFQFPNITDSQNFYSTIQQSGSNRGIMILANKKQEKSTKLAIKNTTYKDWLIYSKDEEKTHLAWVDMGDTLGIWAKYNLGVNPAKLDTAEDWYGNYYAWGEIETKTYYSWIDLNDSTQNYKYANRGYNKLIKYCNDSNYGYNGFTDNLTELVASNDVVNNLLGRNWKIPTYDRLNNLKNSNYATNKWVINYQGISRLNGRVFISNDNGNELFIPVAGFYNGSDLNYAGNEAYLWSSSLDTNEPYNAWNLQFYSYGISMDSNNRCRGFSIHPVL